MFSKRDDIFLQIFYFAIIAILLYLHAELLNLHFGSGGAVWSYKGMLFGF